LGRTKRKGRAPLNQLAGLPAKVLFIGGIIAISFYAIYVVRDLAIADSRFRIEAIEYYGAEHLDEPAVSNLIDQSLPGQLLALDLDKVRALVEAEVWVRRATVRRILPNRLEIHVEERTPTAVAAIDNELFVVDDEGVVLDHFGSSYLYLDQPIVKGLRSLAREDSLHENAVRIQAFLSVVEALKTPGVDHNSSISEIDVGNIERIAVIPKDEPIAIYLGGNRFRKRYETFLSQKQLYYKLKKKYGLIEYVDVTYDDKIIFHTPSEAVPG
jgi:hypothetical protein